MKNTSPGKSIIEKRKSTVVLVPLDKVPSFGGKCVICGQKATDASLKIHDSLENINFKLNLFSFSIVPKCISVPTHLECAKKYKKQFIKRGLFIIATVFLTFAMFGHLPKGILLSIVLPLSIPFLIWFDRHPLPISFYIGGGGINYEFTNKEYAQEFVYLNKLL